MARFKHETAVKDGWTDWISPSLRPNYKMACCDCGLVHDIQFKVVEVIRYLGDRRYTSKPATGHKVIMRVKRNNRSTAAMRRSGGNHEQR